MAAVSSLECPGLCIIVLPICSKAAAQARCILLLLAGATCSPCNLDGYTIAIILRIQLY